jgi:hypothetical protein
MSFHELKWTKPALKTGLIYACSRQDQEQPFTRDQGINDVVANDFRTLLMVCHFKTFKGNFKQDLVDGFSSRRQLNISWSEDDSRMNYQTGNI